MMLYVIMLLADVLFVLWMVNWLKATELRREVDLLRLRLAEQSDSCGPRIP